MDINMDHEVNKLVESLDDAFEEVVEDVFASFAERQYSDWIGKYGMTATSSQEFSNMEDEILRRALEVMILRWKESKRVW